LQLAREVNESIAAIGRRFEVEDVGMDFFCECGAESCTERLSLTVTAYDGLRAVSDALLVDGHALVGAAEALSR
jgi:hypothetical protein